MTGALMGLGFSRLAQARAHAPFSKAQPLSAAIVLGIPLIGLRTSTSRSTEANSSASSAPMALAKSTLMKALTGQLSLIAGKVEIDGINLAEAPELAIAKLGLAVDISEVPLPDNLHQRHLFG